jgi:hypothetical protein
MEGDHHLDHPQSGAEYEQGPGVNDNNHEVVGKLAYLQLAITTKTIIPMWDEDEVPTGNKEYRFTK